jgi:hypothetical protein
MANKPSTIKRKKSKLANPDWATVGDHKFIPIAAWNAVKGWLVLDQMQRINQMDLLRTALPSNDIASITIDKERDLIGLKANHPDWNSFRLFDPEALALIRMLMAFEGRIRMNNRQATDPQKKSGPKTFHPAVNLRNPTNVPLARIVWGATLGEEMQQMQGEPPLSENREIADLLGTFYDLRLSNLNTIASGGAKRDRSDLIYGALGLRKKAAEKFDNLPSGEEYLKLILRCFELLDERKAAVLKSREG